MVGLVDIATLTEKVTVGNQSVEVSGITARGVAMLLGRFPDVRAAMSGIELSADKLMALGPDVVCAVIAAGVGKPGDADTEAQADKLVIEQQVDLLSAILRLTMPGGFGPFAEKLRQLTGALGAGGAASTTEPDTKSRKPSKN